MLEFKQIYKLASAGQALPKHSPPEDRAAYFELFGIVSAYKQGIITKNDATAQKAEAFKRFNDMRKGRLLNLEAYTAYQNGIKAASGKLSELMKAVSPDADFEKLFRDALEIISIFEGHHGNVYDGFVDNKMKESA